MLSETFEPQDGSFLNAGRHFYPDQSFLKSQRNIDQLTGTADGLMGCDLDKTILVRVFPGTYCTNDLQMRCFLFGGESTYLTGYPGLRQRGKQLQKEHAENKTADMRPPGNAGCGSMTAGGIDELQ